MRVVADANVFVPATLGRSPQSPSVRIIDAALDGRIELVMSPARLAEIADVLSRPPLGRRCSAVPGRRRGAGRDAGRSVRSRANKAWRGAGLDPIRPHGARHRAISYFIAACLDWKQISPWAGHGDVRQTSNRYGHRMPGGEDTARERLDAFLTPTQTTPTVAHTVAHNPKRKTPGNAGVLQYRYRDSKPTESE
jgi:PIN domain